MKLRLFITIGKHIYILFFKMKEILDLKKKERLFIEKNIADVDREELKETYKVDDKTLDKII